MASKRNLKKTIRYILEELTMECYVNYMLIESFDEEKMKATIQKISTVNQEFIGRANHPNGTKDAKLIKKYYKKLAEDFNKSVEAIVNTVVEKK